ncbi:ribonuclease P protein component [Phragmitibacter flavus]|uniref:Ribonuclease P protein component n=1 Tax=Phragmitibacter flavus TaxID=2576071 RepID=A0A5R8KKA0_9BACT|nr:ribonuclease P protein component [Phragmitibacter flavus]TLD72049.1 ribonuclease P protein component [Phragmitibacter flavus]
MGLPTSSRLRSTTEFSLVRTKGTSFPARFLVFSVLKLDEPDTPTRFGFITSKKVGGAVQRVRLRRQFREIARLNPLKSGYWIVTIARWRAPQASFEELKQDWLKAARRARVLAPAPAAESPPATSSSSSSS